MYNRSSYKLFLFVGFFATVTILLIKNESIAEVSKDKNKPTVKSVPSKKSSPIKPKAIIPKIKEIKNIAPFYVLYGNSPIEETDIYFDELDIEKTIIPKSFLLEKAREEKVIIESIPEDVIVVNKNKLIGYSISGLRKAGFKVELNISLLQLKISPPEKEIIGDRTINIRNEIKPNELIFGEHNTFSGYSNFFINKQYDSGQEPGMVSSPSPFRIFNEGVFNFKNWILEYSGSYLENSGYNRNDISIVKDDENKGLRFTLGDIKSNSRLSYSNMTVGGLSVRSERLIRPFKLMIPINEYEVFIKTRSKLKVEINNVTVYKEIVDPGKYDLRNFPTVQGQNDIKIIVENDQNSQEFDVYELNSFSFSNDILRKDTHDVFYALGSNRNDNLNPNSNPIEVLDKYYNKNILFLGSHRYGLSDRLTLGMETNLSKDYFLFNPNFTYSSPLGLINLEQAISHNDKSETGYSTKFEYIFRKNRFNLILGLEERFNKFTLFNSSFSENSLKNSFFTNLSFPVSSVAGFSVGASYRNFNDNNNSTQINTGLNYNLRNGMSLNLIGSQEFRSDPKTTPNNFFGRLTFSWNFGNNTTVFAQTETKTQTDQIGMSKNIQVSETEYVGVSGDLRRSIGYNQYQMRLNYFGTKGELGASESILQGIDSLGYKTNIYANTGIAFAGKAMALTRPLSSSFVLFKGTGDLSGQKLMVNPNQNYTRAMAVSDIFGTAIVPASAYTKNTYNVVLPEMDEGTSLEKENHVVYPKYKEGVLIEAKVKKTYTITGVLLDKNKKIMSQVSGELRVNSLKTEDKNKNPISFFTNNNGEFFIEGLDSKHYNLELFNHMDKIINLDLPDSSDYGNVDLGDVYAPFKN